MIWRHWSLIFAAVILVFRFAFGLVYFRDPGISVIKAIHGNGGDRSAGAEFHENLLGVFAAFIVSSVFASPQKIFSPSVAFGCAAFVIGATIILSKTLSPEHWLKRYLVERKQTRLGFLVIVSWVVIVIVFLYTIVGALVFL